MCPAPAIPFSIPLSLKAHQQADFLRRRQIYTGKGKQVYLNTLVVYAVHQYLSCLGIATDLTASDSQDEIYVSLTDTADLMVQGLGKLECCPVLPNSEVITLTAPTNRDRIGCVAVQLDAELRRADLLGFIESWSTPTLLLKDLEPLPALLQHLNTLKQRVNLKLWFQEVTNNTWKSMEQLLDEVTGIFGQTNPAFAYRSNRTTLPNTIPALIELFHNQPDRWTRLQILGLLGSIAQEDESAIAFLTQTIASTNDDELRRQAAVSLGQVQPNHEQAGVRRARVVELGMQFEQQRVLLVMTLTPNQEGDTEVHVRLYPTENQTLPSDLQLSVLNESGDSLLEEQTLRDEDWIQLMFSGNEGDCFSLKLNLGEAPPFLQSFVL